MTNCKRGQIFRNARFTPAMPSTDDNDDDDNNAKMVSFIIVLFRS